TAWKVDTKKAEAGRAAFAARGCASCHMIGSEEGAKNVASEVKAKGIWELDPKAGGLSDKDTKTPRNTLTTNQRGAVASAIGALKQWVGDKGTKAVAFAPIDAGRLTVDANGCRRCHEYEASGGIAENLDKYFTTLGEADLGEEGRRPPRLNG